MFKVLIAEDDYELIQLFKRVLENNGYYNACHDDYGEGCHRGVCNPALGL